MSNRRMAGEKLDERFGEGFTNRTKADGLQDPTAQGGYSKKELLAEFRAGNKGNGNLASKYQDLVDSGEKFNGQAQAYLKSHGVNFNSNGGGSGGGNGGGNSGGGNGGGGNGGGGNNGGGNNNMSHADKAIADAKANETFDFAKMEKSIHERPLYMQAQSDVYASNLWGDMWGSGYGGTWSRGNGSRDNNDDD